MSIVARVESAVARVLPPRTVLAVSGGRDSMALLEAAARVAGERVLCVATFDHGTGAAARRAARLVVRRARALGLPVRVGGVGASAIPAREAAWRAARWRFLLDVARSTTGVVATAHTRDDHLETVLMRALRGSGARGLAGLHARTGVARPLLGLSRRDVEAYARSRGVTWVEDPSNASLAHLRNRVRAELLPVLERARPGLSRELQALSRRAARLRDAVDRHVADEIAHEVHGTTLTVARAVRLGYDPGAWRLLWPALVARIGVALDRRGTERLAEFTISGRRGARIQLSGGLEAVRHGDDVVVRRASMTMAGGEERALNDPLVLGGWRFDRVERSAAFASDLWTALLPDRCVMAVRTWRPGDRMTPHGSATPRRVKRLLRDAGVDAPSRRRWPVVLVGDEIVWVPGVRRTSAATVWSGRPVVLYRCERDDC